MSPEEHLKAVNQLANKIAGSTDTDIALINAGIDRGIDRKLIESCSKRKRRKHVLVILVTEGGSADIAYRISRCLQGNYDRFTILISGVCKSAGTLIALGAHELVVGDLGELGPLDVQLRKADELWELSSGLTAMDALSTLQNKAFSMFEKYLLDLKRNSGGQITLKTAAELASSLTTGLYGKVYAQIDPMRLGEVSRAMNIAQHYGDRLGAKGRNLLPGTVAKLTAAYPTHSFVIDKEEAQSLFRMVRSPSADENDLISLLGEIAYSETIQREPVFDFLNTELSNTVTTDPCEGSNDKLRDQTADRGNLEAARGGVVASSGDTGRESPNGHLGEQAASISVQH